MAALLITQVFSRYVLDSPVGWTEEMARFALVWLTFIGGALVTAEEKQIDVAILGETLARGKRRLIMNWGHLVAAAVTVAILPTAISTYQAMSGIPSPGTGVPRAWLFIPPMVGMALLVLHALLIVGGATEDEEAWEDAPSEEY